MEYHSMSRITATTGRMPVLRGIRSDHHTRNRLIRARHQVRPTDIIHGDVVALRLAGITGIGVDAGYRAVVIDAQRRGEGRGGGGYAVFYVDRGIQGIDLLGVDAVAAVEVVGFAVG